MCMIHLSSSEHRRSMHVLASIVPSNLVSVRATGLAICPAYIFLCSAAGIDSSRLPSVQQCRHSCRPQPLLWPFIPDSYSIRPLGPPQASTLGFFVPYFERAVTRLPTPPYTTTISTYPTTRNPPTEIYSPNQKRL